jgi:hypothetical protein
MYRPDRQDPDSLAQIPFYEYKASSDELRGKLSACSNQYSMVGWKEHLMGSETDPRPQSHKPKQWPDFEGFGLSHEDSWTYEIAMGQLYFAPTVRKQMQARKLVNELATKGPIDLRRALAKARRSIPQVKETLHWHNQFYFFDYLARQQFLWIFLRHESEWLKGEPKEGRAFDKKVQTLAEAYPFLALTPARIAKGLRDPDQTVKDTAIKFGISASSACSLLNRFIHR